MNSRLGAHLRLLTTFDDLARKAIQLAVPFFQCFFVFQATGKILAMTQDEINAFIALRHKHFGNLYLHGSYWVNPAGIKHNGYRVLKRELTLAKKLEFTHVVLHPGTAKGAKDKAEGIDALARFLNKLIQEEPWVHVVLENTTHVKRAIGSDIADFSVLLPKLDAPERIGFCIDTSHAHGYGYSVINPQDQDAFIDLLDEMIGIDKIVLLHINDTREKCGSHIDRHDIVGQGIIGQAALKRFVTHSRLQHIPFLMELPVVSEDEEIMLLQKVREW